MKALDRFRAGVSGMAGGCRGWRAAAAAFALLLTMGMRPAAAQGAPAADAGGAHLSVGGAISGYVLGYGNVKLYGPSVFVDIDTLRHLVFAPVQEQFTADIGVDAPGQPLYVGGGHDRIGHKAAGDQ